MFFFFHLITGLIIGFLIGDLLHDRRWLLPCAVGAVLPDIIDKPLGHILFSATIGYGRIYAHTLLACVVVAAAGLFVWQYKKNPVVLAVATGIFSHQLLDLMWREPVNWYYPFLGPFRWNLPPDNIVSLVFAELNNPSEVALAMILGIGIVLFWHADRLNAQITHHRTMIRGMMGAGALLLCVLSGGIMAQGIVRGSLPYLGWAMPEEYFLGGIVIALAALMVWRTRAHKKNGEGT